MSITEFIGSFVIFILIMWTIIVDIVVTVIFYTHKEVDPDKLSNTINDIYKRINKLEKKGKKKDEKSNNKL